VVFAYGAEPDQLSLTNTTVTGNSLMGASNITSAPPYAGIFALGTVDLSSFVPATLTNTLAANNTIDGSVSTCSDSVDFGGGPVSVPMSSGGGNVVDNNTCAFAFAEPTDQNNVLDLFTTLASPAYNNGFVQTVALLEGSPAINAGVNVAFSQDAQILARSQGGGVDAGAYESPFSLTSGSDSSSGGSTNERNLAETGNSQAVVALAAIVFTVLAITATLQAGRKLQA
jgi:hypothetical protein